MSYYFAIIGRNERALFEHEFGTSRQGGDGVARFLPEARALNRFIVHSSLDLVEEIQWNSGNMFLKNVDRHIRSYVFCFLTGGNVKFLLLVDPSPPITVPATSAVAAAAAAATAPPNDPIMMLGAAGSGDYTSASAGPSPSARAPAALAALAPGAAATHPPTTSGGPSSGFNPTGPGPSASNSSVEFPFKGLVSSAGFGHPQSTVVGVGGSSSNSSPPPSSYNPAAPSTEEPIKNFLLEVYDSWVKTLMNPFYLPDMPLQSSVFRSRVSAAARKYL